MSYTEAMKVADLSMEELEALVRRKVDEALAEREDDDEDQLEFREDFVAEVHEALAATDPGVSADEARRILGLDD